MNLQVVVDEEAERSSNEWTLGTLIFSVFDFARMCGRKTKEQISDRLIEVDLHRLRQNTIAHVQVARDELEQERLREALEAEHAAGSTASREPSLRRNAGHARKRPRKDTGVPASNKKSKTGD